jgi:hypothetical protein
MERLGSVIIDSLAMLAFTTVVCASIEMGAVGMTLPQTMHARLGALPVNLATGRPYGLYRDWLIARLCYPCGIRLIFVEILTFTTFQIPLYLMVLMLVGVDEEQIVTSSLMMILLFGVLGRIYGSFLDRFRALMMRRSTC